MAGLIEVDEGEWAAHRRVTEAMQKLLNNPTTRRKVLEAQKILDPNLAIPELDAAEPLRSEMNDVRSTVDELKQMLADQKAEREQEARMAKLNKTWEAGQSKLRTNGYTDEGLAEVEKFMELHGVADHEVAAAAFERMHPPAEPVKAVGGNRFDLFEPDTRSSEEMQKLFADPDDPMVLNSLINNTLRQVRGR
jgi:hypothetical protein